MHGWQMERQAAERVRLEAEERARDAQRQRDAAAAERAEAEEMGRQHEMELERNRQEQERIRSHQMKVGLSLRCGTLSLLHVDFLSSASRSVVLTIRFPACVPDGQY